MKTCKELHTLFNLFTRLGEGPGVTPSGYLRSPETKILVSVSGGKDSVISWAICEALYKNEIIPVFANTGHESEVTYAYLGYLEDRMSSQLRYVERKVESWGSEDWYETSWKALKRDVMTRLGKKKKSFPRTMAKWCTTILKIEPIKWWFDTLEGDYILITGLRAQESPRRAKAAPYVEEDPLYGCPRWHIIFDWTQEEVFAWHKHLGVEPNPLYSQGFTRVGCFPCIYARKSEIRNIAEHYPQDIERMKEMETEANFTFFHYDKIPERFRDENGQAPIENVAVWSKWNRGEPDPPEIAIADQEDLDTMVCDSYGFCG